MRTFHRTVLTTVAFVHCAVVPAQVPRAAITLGMPGVDVRKTLGTPMAYRDPNAKQRIPSDRAGLIPPSSRYQDIYVIKTLLNTYELSVEYASDDSESRLNPTPRVIAVYFELDRRMSSGSDMLRLLEDLPELAALCGEECTIAGQKPPGGDTLYLHPKTLMPAKLAEAERIGSLFGQFPGQGRRPTAWLVLEGGAIIKVIILEDHNSREGPVQTTTWKPHVLP
jgi:hypothetical protein